MNPEFGSKSELSETTAKKLAALYAEVFGASPWNEVWRCLSCNRFYGPRYSQNTASPCCSTPLANAYPEKETIGYIQEELSKPQAQLRLFYSSEGRLVAFAWGYKIENATILAQKKWPQSSEIQDSVLGVISSFVDPISPLFYISEVGVAFPSRGNGTGLRLTEDLLNYGNTLLREPVIFRTSWTSPMMRIATRLKMTQIMGPKITISGNQIAKTDKIAGFIDEINPDRTLFIKLP